MPSGVERVPALVLCFAGAGRVGAGGCVVVPCELVVACCTGVLVGDAPAVRGAEAILEAGVSGLMLDTGAEGVT